jgi:hypothetical protein
MTYQNYNESFETYSNIKTISSDEFNTLFSTQIPKIDKLVAIGIDVENDIVIAYLSNFNDMPNDTINLFISFWVKTMHPLLNKTKYSFLYCPDDGFGEKIPLSPSKLSNTFLKEIKMPILASCKKTDDDVTICTVDPHFIAYEGYVSNLKLIDEKRVKWDDKIKKCLWRGTLNNGSDKNFIEWEDKDGKNQRQYFIDVYGNDKFPLIDAETSGASTYLTIDEQIKYKYLLDIDGWSSAWSATVWKLYSGSVLLKVDSVWKQWYYDDGFRPWIHYIPIMNEFNGV